MQMRIRVVKCENQRYLDWLKFAMKEGSYEDGHWHLWLEAEKLEVGDVPEWDL
jgi:hypothetical protein